MGFLLAARGAPTGHARRVACLMSPSQIARPPAGYTAAPPVSAGRCARSVLEGAVGRTARC